MIEHPDSEAVSVENILATRPGCRGLGAIGKNKNSSGTLGLHMHSTCAVGGDGIPLGVPRIEFDAPEAGADGVPEEERKTRRRVRGLRDSAALAAPLEGVRTVAVIDREGDAAEVFAEWQSLGGGIDLLVRARRDRSLGGGRKLFERMRGLRAGGGSP